MRARALVHELRNGQKIYSRLYGNQDDQLILKAKLEETGYISGNQAARGVKVVGHVAKSYKPYCDAPIGYSEVRLESGKKAWVFHT